MGTKLELVVAGAPGIHSLEPPLTGQALDLMKAGGVSSQVHDFGGNVSLWCRSTRAMGAAVECGTSSVDLTPIEPEPCEGRLAVVGTKVFYSCPAQNEARTWRINGGDAKRFGPQGAGTGYAIDADGDRVYLSADAGMRICSNPGGSDEPTCAGPVGVGGASPVANIDASHEQYVFFLRGNRLLRWTRP